MREDFERRLMRKKRETSGSKFDTSTYGKREFIYKKKILSTRHWRTRPIVGVGACIILLSRFLTECMRSRAR
jgi:hypothetical protein